MEQLLPDDPPLAPPAVTTPGADHNQPSARAYLHDMRHAAHQFVTSDHAAEAHLLSVLEHAYRLRAYREESDAHRDEVDGLLGNKKIADTARTRLFTRLLKLAFHNDQLDDKSRISRCSAALQHAWAEGVPPDDLRTFIASKGGIVKCGKVAKAAPGGAATARPDPIPVSCIEAAILQGHKSLSGILRATEAGVVFVPSKVLSPVRQRAAANASG
jgi:hypothetical protein